MRHEPLRLVSYGVRSRKSKELPQIILRASTEDDSLNLEWEIVSAILVTVSRVVITTTKLRLISLFASEDVVRK
jgi:hypothetical protein